MDVLDGHRSDCFFIDHHSQEANKCETSIANSNLLQTSGQTNCPHEQSSGALQQQQQQHERLNEQDSPIIGTNLQYASRAHQAANKSDNALDQQQQHQYGPNEYEFITSNDSANHCEQTSLFEARMTGQDDAFVPFCAEAIPDNDTHRRYYTNKLYEPLKSGVNNSQVQQNQLHHNLDHQHQQHLDNEPFHIDDQDDELSLLAQLDFIESSTQNLCAGRERTDFNKILEGDDDCSGDCDDDNEANLGKDDSLDALQLTSLIDSFVDFVPSPLIDTRTADDQLDLPLCGSRVSTNADELPDSSERGDERLSPMDDQQLHHEISYVSADGYNHSQADQYLVAKNNQHQRMFSDQNYPHQPNTCYSIDANHVHSTIQDHHEPIFNSQHDRSEQLQGIANELNGCLQVVPMQTQADQNNKVSSSDCLQSINYKNGTLNAASVNSSEKKRLLEDEPKQQARRSKLKKRRSTLSIAEKNKKNSQQVDLIEDTNYENDKTTSAQMEHINELTNRLMNDEDESLVSDNNSLRSDSCRRNPIVNHYRRRTANARERIRMREINQAFEKLKKVVPIELVEQAALESGEMSDQASAGGGRRKSSPSSGASHQGDSVKLTKITTLRMAVSYIAKLTEILNQNPEPPSSSSSNIEAAAELKRKSKSINTKRTDNNAKEASSKTTSRQSRSKSKKSSQDTVKRRPAKADQKQVPLKSSPTVEDKYEMKTIGSSCGGQAIKTNQTMTQDRAQHQLVVDNSVFNRVLEQQQQQQTAFISIPNQQKQQYHAPYPNQQQLLISQTIGSNHERLVTPVAVAILGIPTTNNTNNQPPASSNELIGSQNIQLVGIQKTSPQAMGDGQQQHRAYNLQIAQAQQQQPHAAQQNRQPQQVTLTLDEMSGMPVLRLTNPQVQNQPIPLQIRTISNQNHQIIQQSQQQSQIFTTQNGVNYALRPILSQLANGSTNSINTPSESPMPTNFQLSTIRVCSNSNQPNNLISQSSNNLINNDNNNSNNHLIRGNYSVLRRAPVDTNEQSQMCQHIGSISSQQHFNSATFTTGMSSDQASNMTAISTNGSNAIDRQLFENQTNHQIQLSSQQPLNNLQQSNCLTSKTMFVPASNIMTLTNGSRVLHTRPISLQAQSPFGGEFQIGQNKTANLVYINTLPQANVQAHQQVQQQQQVCILTEQSQETPAKRAVDYVQASSEQQDQQNNLSAAERTETTVRTMTRDKMSYVTHFNAQSDQCQVGAANEANITQLVTSLATSIQPPKSGAQTMPTSANADGKAKEGSHQRQSQQQPQHQQQQQPVRTYRFHNYDGNMINNHLYGNTNQNQQLQQQSSGKQRPHSSKHQTDHADKAAEVQQVSPKQRSRQNSLSSICSTTSCSSSSLNYTSSSGCSPSNSVPVVSIMVGSSPGGNRSLTSSTSPIMIEEGLLNSTSMPRSARIVT